jgi:glycosyltransferase involved in cell wall biosynthesis
VIQKSIQPINFNKPVSVSVVIPFHNRISYVERAVQSVISQSSDHWEIILVDDCSEDKLDLNTLMISVPREKFIYLRNENNMGPGFSRQRGLEISRGDFVCFLDSDDFYASNFIKKMLECHLANPLVSGVYCTSVNLSDGAIRKESNKTFDRILPNLLKYNRPWSTASWMWKKDQIASWSKLRTNEDWLFEINTAAINNSIAHLDHCLCFIDSATGQNIRDNIDQISPEVDRNRVAVHLINILHLFKSHDNRIEIRKSAISRILYTTSKLTGLGKRNEIIRNGYLLLNVSFFNGLLLLFMGLTILPINIQLRFYKKLLIRYSVNLDR